MNRRWFLGISMLALTGALGAGLSAIPAVRGSETSTVGQRLEGTWLSTAHLDSAPPGVPLTIVSLQTFLPDGAFFETPGRAPSPARSPVGHGQWVRTGDRLFTATFTFFTFDPQGTQTGIQRITSAIRLSEDLQELQHTTRNEQFDLDGRVVFRGGATGTAQRLTVGDSPPAP